jgi:hypothetical protein
MAHITTLAAVADGIATDSAASAANLAEKIAAYAARSRLAAAAIYLPGRSPDRPRDEIATPMNNPVARALMQHATRHGWSQERIQEEWARYQRMRLRPTVTREKTATSFTVTVLCHGRRPQALDIAA